MTRGLSILYCVGWDIDERGREGKEVEVEVEAQDQRA